MNQRPPPIPEGLDVLPEGRAVVIRRRWFTHLVWPLIIFCVAWDSFLIFWYTMALSGTDKAPGGFHLIAIIFPIGHVAVGCGLTYTIFCIFLNKTDVILHPDALTIKTHPLPWRGNKTIPATDLVSFLVRERQTGSEDRRTHYDLQYVDSSNHEKALIKSLPKAEQADYLALALTQFYFPNQTGMIERAL